MRKKVAVCVVIIAALCVIIYAMSFTSLSKQMDKQLSSSDKWTVQSVEQMESDKNPIVHDVKSSSATYQSLVQEIEKTKLKKVRTEEGMEIKDVLYTMAISSEDDTMTVTVNNDGELHVNQTDVTYTVRNSDSKLYELLQELYNENK